VHIYYISHISLYKNKLLNPAKNSIWVDPHLGYCVTTITPHYCINVNIIYHETDYFKVKSSWAAIDIPTNLIVKYQKQIGCRATQKI